MTGHRNSPDAGLDAGPPARQVEVTFDRKVVETAGGRLVGADLDTVQVNIGLACNLACRHCHLGSGPKRTERMDWPTMEAVLAAARAFTARRLDITGGAPEMHSRFRDLVVAARRQDLQVTVRTNLAILLDPSCEDLPQFLADHRVHLVASLPCYLEANVDRQRGRRVYARSVEAIRRLNSVGYGIHDDLSLDLVYNPAGPGLPPDQAVLETDYREFLDEHHGVRFTGLLTITNMPIGRFLADLRRNGEDEEYRRRLRDSFNPGTLDGLMCRHQVHVGHDGTLYDCDFNYALGLPITPGGSPNIRDLDPGVLRHRSIATGEHCFGCTAGRGSSCGGALA